ncbi:MAG: hypothetical protein IPK21_15445 [Haliscomenobacter sp.]|nr:hypothetical protein [Haliscomenobacter sp.]
MLDAISVGRAALSLNSPEYRYIEDRIFAAQDKGRFTILSGNECGNVELEAALIPDLHCDGTGADPLYRKKTIKGQPVLCPAGDAYIQVQPVHEYNLLFPEDLYGECEDLRDTANVVDGGELGCDVLAVNVSDKRYNGATLNGAPVAECYKIFRTFTVVNWCQYDEACGEPMQWAVVVPRDADGVNVLVRDADGGGEEAIYVEAGDTGDKVAQETERVTEFRFNNPENARCPHTDELFAWMYTQYIFVHDQEAPAVLDPGAQVFYLNKTACTGDVRFIIEAEDACAPATELQQQPGAAGNLAIERARLRLDTDNDPATPQPIRSRLGSLEVRSCPLIRFTATTRARTSGYSPARRCRKATHALLVAVRDDCGNLSAVREIPFSVVDTSVTAICHHG